MSENSGVKMKSLQKALEILNCFVEKQPLGVTEISENLGLYKSNVYYILSTLAEMQYLEKDADTGKYSLGIAASKLGAAVGDKFSFLNIAKHHMQKLADSLETPVYLTVVMEDELFTLHVSLPSSSNTYFIGNVRKAGRNFHSSSCGKALLAYMSTEYQENYLSNPLEKCTEHTIVDPAKLREELKKVQTLGYAMDDMETEIGIRCVGVPVIGRNGTVVASLSVSGPAQQYTTEMILSLSNKLKQCAISIHNDC